MATKIEKLGLVDPYDANILFTDGNPEFPSYIKVNADFEVELKVVKSGANGTLRPKWIAKPREKGPFTSKDLNAHTGDVMGAKVEAKYCGPQIYHVEPFLDEPINKTPNRILIQGYAPEKIVKAEWRKTKEGSSLGSTPNKFGDNVWLHLDTEGLNGARLKISVYNDGYGDELVGSYVGTCFGGEMNVNFKDTFSWRASTGWWTSNSEEFYVKVQVSGKSYYIKDAGGNEEIAKHIIFEDENTKRTTEKSTNNLPVTIDENEIDLERYEPCRFKAITVTDEGDDIPLFEEGALKLGQDRKKEFAVSENIFFEFDKWDVTPSAQGVLDGIATFLLDSPFVPVTLGAHCDARGSHEYNDALSFRRAASSVEYLVSKGVSSSRIKSKGYGKRKPIIPGEDLSEEEHRQNRRVTVKFNISGGDAESIVFNTIAPDKSMAKILPLKVENYNVKKCLRKDLNDSHDDKVYVVELTAKGKSNPYDYAFDKIEHKVYSDSTGYKLAPLDFILPHKTTPNKFLYYINSCRYYSDKDKATLVTNVYPDIKWDFHFFLNLSNALSVKWQKLGFAKHKEMQSKAGKLGAEKRWQQTDIDFGVILEAQWNKRSKDDYKDKTELTLKIEARIKTLYEIFSQIKEASKLISGGTKAKAVATVGKRFPLGVEIKPPNFCLGAEWQLARGIKNGKKTSEIGTLIEFYFKAEPLIALELTLDLLQGVISTTGPAAPILSAIRDWLKDDKTSNLTIDLYVDLIIFGEIKVPDLSLAYNTASDSSDPAQITSLDASATIGLKLEAGLVVKAKAVVLVAEFYAEAYAKFEGEGSITFGHSLNYQNNKLNYRPVLIFDGLKASIEIKAEIGLQIKKSWFEADYNKKLDDLKKEIEIFDPFDIVEAIEDATGLNASITLIG